VNKHHNDKLDIEVHVIDADLVKTDSPHSIQDIDMKLDNNKKNKKKHWVLKIVVILLAIALLVAGYFGWRTYVSLHKVIKKNNGITAAGLKSADIAPENLKGEGDGRVNILLMGMGDPGHAGEYLTDTIMVASYDPKSKDVAMLSIPRDLYVKIPGYGFSKINAANAYGEQNKPGSGSDLVKQTVSQVLGIPIHYYVRVDFSALKQAVDSVGGVDVNVTDSLADPEYPCERNEGLSCGYSILAGQQHFNGSAALKYVRCRKGNCGDDYGRAKRQQDVLVALRQKATQLNYLTNPKKITDLLDIVGNNVTTDLQLWEIERLVSIAKDTDPTKIVNKVLDNSTNNLVKNSQVGDASVVVPALGIGNYTDIQAFVRSIFVDGYLKNENATIQVENGTTNLNMGNLVTKLLKSYNYNVVATVPAPTTYRNTQIIDNTAGKKPYTIQYLEKRFGVKAQAPADGSTDQSKSDITIIVGSDYKTY